MSAENLNAIQESHCPAKVKFTIDFVARTEALGSKSKKEFMKKMRMSAPIYYTYLNGKGNPTPGTMYNVYRKFIYDDPEDFQFTDLPVVIQAALMKKKSTKNSMDSKPSVLVNDVLRKSKVHRDIFLQNIESSHWIMSTDYVSKKWGDLGKKALRDLEDVKALKIKDARYIDSQDCIISQGKLTADFEDTDLLCRLVSDMAETVASRDLVESYDDTYIGGTMNIRSMTISKEGQELAIKAIRDCLGKLDEIQKNHDGNSILGVGLLANITEK